MNTELISDYRKIRKGGFGFYEQKRGLIKVSGKEAVQFLNGLITNDVAKLEENAQMLAAFPNVQGRLLAIVRILRCGEKFLFETDSATHEKVFQNLFRFTYAGDFFVENLMDDFKCFEITNHDAQNIGAKYVEFQNERGKNYFVPTHSTDNFRSELINRNAVQISGELDEILRVENGIPKYGVDADETTIVPELGINGLISYNKGCYIGQEIIARIHFRGHVAKQLTGLILAAEAEAGDELKSLDGKNAGKITSVVFSPTLEKFIALAFVRYDFLAEGTELKIGETSAMVRHLPFI